MSTTIKSHYSKPLKFQRYGSEELLLTHDVDRNGNSWPVGSAAIFKTGDIVAALKAEGALPEPEGFTITDLPEVKDAKDGYLEAGHTFRYVESGNHTSEKVLKGAKELLAIGLALQKREEAAKAEAEAKAAAEEAKQAEVEAAKLRELRRAVLLDHMYGLGYSWLPSYSDLGRDKRKIVDALVQAKQTSV